MADNLQKFRQMRNREPRLNIRQLDLSPVQKMGPILRQRGMERLAQIKEPKIKEMGDTAIDRLQTMGQKLGGQVKDLGRSVSDKIMDVKTRVTQKFGNFNPNVEVFSGGVNYGTDYATPTGTELKAPKGEWQVIESFNKASGNRGDNRGYGNSVVIKNLQTGETLRFSHLSNVGVQVGQQLINSNNIIGLTGSTGNSTGPHLDVQYRDPQGQLRDFQQSPYNNLIG